MHVVFTVNRHVTAMEVFLMSTVAVGTRAARLVPGDLSPRFHLGQGFNLWGPGFQCSGVGPSRVCLCSSRRPTCVWTGRLYSSGGCNYRAAPGLLSLLQIARNRNGPVKTLNNLGSKSPDCAEQGKGPVSMHLQEKEIAFDIGTVNRYDFPRTNYPAWAEWLFAQHTTTAGVLLCMYLWICGYDATRQMHRYARVKSGDLPPGLPPENTTPLSSRPRLSFPSQPRFHQLDMSLATT